MRGIRRLVCSKAFALGVLCAYASVAAVFLTVRRTTLFCGDGTNDISMREAIGTSLFISITGDEEEEDKGTILKLKSDSLFADDGEELSQSQEVLDDIANGTTRTVRSTSKSQIVTNIQESWFANDVMELKSSKEGPGDVVNGTTRSARSVGESRPATNAQNTTFVKGGLYDDTKATVKSKRMIGESLPLVAITNKETTLEKEWQDNNANATKSMHVVDESHPTAANAAETPPAKELRDVNVTTNKESGHLVGETHPTAESATEPIPSKERHDTGIATTKASVRVVDDSVVEPTLPIELRTDRAVTMEMRGGFKTWCTKKNSANQHGLECRRRIPLVLGIGMERCGTTALSFFLRMHPDIVHAKPKDVYYWNHYPDRSLDWYRVRMPISSKYQVTMEYTPSYILSHEVPFLIKKAMPDMKFIVMIRDPIERAMSYYLYMRHSRRPEYLKYISPQPGSQTNPFLGSSFSATVLKQNGDVFEDNAVIENALYVSHLRRWFDVFPREQFLIIDEGVFRKDPVPVLQQVEDFIGISKFFNKDYLYFDHDRDVFCQRVPYKHCSKRSVKNVHPPIEKHVLKKLRDYYHPYNIRLEALLNRTFPWT